MAEWKVEPMVVRMAACTVASRAVAMVVGAGWVTADCVAVTRGMAEGVKAACMAESRAGGTAVVATAVEGNVAVVREGASEVGPVAMAAHVAAVVVAGEVRSRRDRSQSLKGGP